MIDKNSNKPIYNQIADYLKLQIETGKFEVGNLIPSENVIAEECKVSRMTVRHAIDTLVNEGYLYKKRGKGTYVADFMIKHSAYKLRGFTEEILQFNKKPTNKVIRFEVKDVDTQMAEKLKIAADEQIYIVERVRYVDEEPVVFERSYMPVEMFPELSIHVFKGSKYRYVEDVRKEKIKESIQEIEPEIVEEPIKTLLDMKENTPILKVKSTTILDNELVFEYSETYFKTTRYKFIQKSSRY